MRSFRAFLFFSPRGEISTTRGEEKVVRMNNTNVTKGKLVRIVAFLTREEIDFIDKLAKDALFSTGHKLSRTDIVRALIDATKVKDINAEDIHSKSELEHRLLAIMKMSLPQTLYNLKKERTNHGNH